MLSAEERLKIGLKVLKDLKPSLKAGTARVSINQKGEKEGRNTSEPTLDIQDDEQIPDAEQDPVSDHLEEDDPEVEAVFSPGLGSLLHKAGPLPPCTVVIGQCEDELPFTLDLSDPTPGSILILGDSGCGKTRLLHSILYSTELVNRPNQVAYRIVTGQLEDYESLAESPNCQQVLAANDPGVTELALNLLSAMEQRQNGNLRGPAILLALDDLVSCTQEMDEETLNAIFEIIQNGPEVRIWVFATLVSDQVDMVDESLFEAFGTRLVGNVIAPGLASYLTEDPASGVEDLPCGYQFSVLYDGNWIRFWICEPEE
jgi:hypothetical protein